MIYMDVLLGKNCQSTKAIMRWTCVPKKTPRALRHGAFTIALELDYFFGVDDIDELVTSSAPASL